MHLVTFTVRIKCDSYEFIENLIVKISSQWCHMNLYYLDIFNRMIQIKDVKSLI